MRKRSIQDVQVAGKRVLIRVDFNVPMQDGVIQDDRRIRAAVPTIRGVLDRGGSVVLLSHMGRPTAGGYEARFSLAPCAVRLGEILGTAVGFPSHDCVDEDAVRAVANMGDGDVVLLENLRFHNAEKNGDAEFAAKLALHGDVYCNDAFGASHRDDASMVALPNAMQSKPRAAGRLLERELEYLAGAIAAPERPFVAVLGGAKVSDKVPAVQRMLTLADKVLVGGAMAYTFLDALGKGVGESRVENGMRGVCKSIIDLAARETAELFLPEDHVCAREFSERARGVTVCDGDIGGGLMGLDIGPKTQARYAQAVRDAKTVVWNGPMGVFEWNAFGVGTEQLAGAAAEATRAGATTIVGGGDTALAAARFGVEDKVSHVSTGGGASLELLAGKQFASVRALQSKEQENA